MIELDGRFCRLKQRSRPEGLLYESLFVRGSA